MDARSTPVLGVGQPAGRLLWEQEIGGSSPSPEIVTNLTAYIVTGSRRMHAFLAPEGDRRGVPVLYDTRCPLRTLIGVSVDGRVAYAHYQGELWDFVSPSS